MVSGVNLLLLLTLSPAAVDDQVQPAAMDYQAGPGDPQKLDQKHYCCKNGVVTEASGQQVDQLNEGLIEQLQ